MRSTQDLCMFMKNLSMDLYDTFGLHHLSIELFDDKSFRINLHKEGAEYSETIYDSDAFGDYDINDLPYVPVEMFAKELINNYSVKDVKAEDL